MTALATAALLGVAPSGSGAGSAAGASADGVRICGDRDVLLEQFAMQHDETPQALGSAPTGA